MHDDKLTVFVVDDDPSVRRSVVRLLETAGLRVEGFVSAEAFLDRGRPVGPGCLLLDVRMSGMSGLELQRQLAAAGRPMATVFITGHGDVPHCAGEIFSYPTQRQLAVELRPSCCLGHRPKDTDRHTHDAHIFTTVMAHVDRIHC